MTAKITRLSLIFCMLILFSSAFVSAQDTPQPPAKTNDTKFGVGMVPYMDGGYFFFDSDTNADNVERMLYRIVGELPEIDNMYVINDSEHMLRSLMKLKNMGKKIDYLVLAGHGSRDTPGIKWGKDDMIPEEVNIKWTDDQLSLANSLLKDPKKSNMKPDDIRKRRDELSSRSQLLHNVGLAMAPDATVVLINCSAAATPKGEKFVKSLGETLLGKHGGTIVASRTDIKLYEVNWYGKGLLYMLRQLKIPSWNETLINGDWVSVRIPPGMKRWDLVDIQVDAHNIKNGKHDCIDDYGKNLGYYDYTFTKDDFKVHTSLFGGDWNASAKWELPEYILEGVETPMSIECKGDTPTKPGMKCRLSVSPTTDPYSAGYIYVTEVWHDGEKNVAIEDIKQMTARTVTAIPNVGGWCMDTDSEPVRVALGHEVIRSSKASYVINTYASNCPEFSIIILGSGEDLADTPLVTAKYKMAKPVPIPPANSSKPTTLNNTIGKPKSVSTVQSKPNIIKPSTSKPTPKPAEKPAPTPAQKPAQKPTPPKADFDTAINQPPGTPSGPDEKVISTAFSSWSPTKMVIRGILTTIELKDNKWVVTKLPGPVMQLESELISIDGRKIAGLSAEEIRDLILGKPGTQIELVFKEPNGFTSNTGYIRK